MKLTPTPQSIVPEQSVIDSWPQMRRKKSTHPCQAIQLHAGLLDKKEKMKNA